MWSRENIQRLLLDFSLKSSNQIYSGDHRIYQYKNADLKNDIGLDSMELLQLAAYANNFFNLFHLKEPPYLLSKTKLTDWIDLIYEARTKTDLALKFQTSGTTGNRKIIEHSIPFLKREISFHANLFKNCAQIITFIPSYSIYGFLFTIGLPAHLQVPVIYPSQVNWLDLQPGTLIVATPFQWQLLVDSLPEKMVDIYGVTAASPMHQELIQQIHSKNIKLTEIYGATETGGIGYRKQGQDRFTLFPYWQINMQNQINDLIDIDSKQCYSLMDEISLFTDQTFTVKGRKDQQIKIAGHLVNLAHVKNKLLKLTNLKDCLLSAKADQNEMIIQADLCLYQDDEHARLAIKQEIRKLLPAHEQPRICYFTQ